MSPTDEADKLAPGDLVGGKYRIDGSLGEGGMGVVYAATHVTLGLRVAVKCLLPTMARHADATERFLREARSIVAMKGEHVARVMDVGTFESGAPYMVMEFLEGVDLSHVIGRGRLPVEAAVAYVLQACEAIAEAHSGGIVHRDLKPSNVFLTTRPDGSPLVKVLDFGIAKALSVSHADQAKLTGTGVVMGTPAYMSPEQVRDAGAVDERTDLWSLGVILYECLTGALPFDATTPSGMCAAVAADAPKPLTAFLSEAPAGLEAVVMRCLEKNRDDRFPDVGALAQALAPFAPPDAQPSVARILRLLRRNERGAPESAAKTARPTSRPEETSETVMAGPVSPPATGADDDTIAAETASFSEGRRGVGRRTWTILTLVLLSCAAVAWLVLSAATAPDAKPTSAAFVGAPDPSLVVPATSPASASLPTTLVVSEQAAAQAVASAASSPPSNNPPSPSSAKRAAPSDTRSSAASIPKTPTPTPTIAPTATGKAAPDDLISERQ